MIHLFTVLSDEYNILISINKILEDNISVHKDKYRIKIWHFYTLRKNVYGVKNMSFREPFVYSLIKQIQPCLSLFYVLFNYKVICRILYTIKDWLYHAFFYCKKSQIFYKKNLQSKLDYKCLALKIGVHLIYA